MIKPDQVLGVCEDSPARVWVVPIRSWENQDPEPFDLHYVCDDNHVYGYSPLDGHNVYINKNDVFLHRSIAVAVAHARKNVHEGELSMRTARCLERIFSDRRSLQVSGKPDQARSEG